MPRFLLPFYKIIYQLRSGVIGLFRRVAVFSYYEPMFRSRCKAVGKGLHYVKLRQGFPHFYGNLQIYLGNTVTVHSRASFSAGKVFDKPSFQVGDNTYLGPGVSVGVAKKVSIGSFCYISSNVSISDNDGHPLDSVKRRRGESVSLDAVLPVKIGDQVWIGEGTAILKGVTIGDGAVISAKSVVMRDIPPFTLAAGNPAIAIGKIPQKGLDDIP